MAGDVDDGVVGHRQIGTADEFARDFERNAPGRLDRDRAIGQLQQPRMAQHDAQVGKLDIAIGATADGDFGDVERAGADDVTPIGTFRNLADDKAHDITSKGKR